MALHLKLNEDDGVHFNGRRCASYNMFMNIITGGRGIGKTVHYLIGGVKNYINKGEQFIYMRRYKPEIKEWVNKNELSIVADGIRIIGGNDSYVFLDDKKEVGYGMVLSTSMKYKSIELPKVTMIIYDEVTLLRSSTNRYLQKEVTFLLEFISTVMRTRKNLKVYLLGNNLDLFNPYFDYFKVPLFTDVYVDKRRGLYCEMPKNSPALMELEKETPLYKLTKGTSYGDYHYDNKVLTKADGLIEEKPRNCGLFIRLGVNNTTLNVYFTDKDGKRWMYVEIKEKPIKDKFYLPIINNGNINYYFAKQFKARLYMTCNKYFSTDLISYNNERARDIYSALMEVSR